MGLRCFLFTSDLGTSATILQVLAGLDVDTESCAEAVVAAEKIANQSFQIVIIDWDTQQEAALLLSTARQRKASERPITLAMVSDDLSVPQALQAGANSILRKPILVSQAKDTLQTARDLLRAKREPGPVPAFAVQAAPDEGSAAPSPAIPVSLHPANEKALRAGEFLQSGPAAPGGSFVTESTEAHASHSLHAPVDPLKDLEPVAASVAEDKPSPLPPPPPGETRSLEWYLKARGRQAMSAAAAPAPAPDRGNSELMGYDQMTSSPSPASHASLGEPEHQRHERQKNDQKKEAELFAYIEGGAGDSEEPAGPRFRLGRGAIAAALLLAAGAIAAAPQAPWHPKMRVLWAHGQKSLHTWLNPQPVTPVQAPAAHEDFGRAGDEYKLPAAENIPDATTDPSQIRVVPVIDPTAKKPNNDGANPDQTAVPVDPSAAPPDGTSQAPAVQVTPVQVTEVQPSAPTATAPQPSTTSPATVPSGATVTSNPPAPQVDTPVPVRPPVASNPVPVKSSQPHHVPAVGIPSSLKSQMAAATPDPGGTKLPENALPSIEPVAVQESVERALLSDQPALVYPANAKGQTGTVILQVLIGRDGTVQDAKFLQGSLAFARNAIDGVRKWKFKPYTMNGRPVSVQTNLTVTFKPGS